MAQVQRRRAMKSRAAVAKQSLRDYLMMALVVAAVVIAVILFMRRGTSESITPFSSTDTFFSGVYVNGISLGGMTLQEGTDAVNKQIQDRLNSPINLHYQGEVYTITPAELDAQMLEVDNNIAMAWNFGHTGDNDSKRAQIKYLRDGNTAVFESKLTYNEEKLQQFIDRVKVNVDVHPVNANIETDASQNFRIIAHQDGSSLDADQLRDQIAAVIEQGASADITLNPKVWHPQYTTEMMQACTTLLSECTTDARSSNEDRTRNIKRALYPFRQMIVQPGQTVSFNDVVGKRTLENGFYPAIEFIDGALGEGIGGGTCQASSTLFVALVRAGFTIDQRTQHSLRVAYCNPSQDATVTDGGKDLVFTNNTKYPMYIFATCSWTEATVRVYGMKPKYRIKYVTKTIERDIPWSGYNTAPDYEHKFVKKPDAAPVIKTEGKLGCVTEGWIQYFDWETGELVDQARLSRDEYKPMKPTYYVWAE